MARSAVSSLAHAHLNAFVELVHKHQPARALAHFSNYLDGKQQDAVSANAVQFITHAIDAKSAAEQLLARANHAKSQVAACGDGLASFVAPRVSGRAVVAHPLNAFSGPLLKSAKQIRFLNSKASAAHRIASQKLAAHPPLNASAALDHAEMLLLAPRAITPEGIVIEHGGRLLAELAAGRGIPVYALATSWHASPRWKASKNEEVLPARAVSGILSEHGIYAHKEFLGRVQKAFPWLLTSP